VSTRSPVSHRIQKATIPAMMGKARERHQQFDTE
jgi:hypothetical protein